MKNKTGSKQRINDMIRSRQSSMCNCKKCDTKSMWLHVNDKKLPILVTGPVLVVSGTSPLKKIFVVLELKHQTLYIGGNTLARITAAVLILNKELKVKEL